MESHKKRVTKNTLRGLGNYISAQCISTIRPTAITLLKSQSIDAKYYAFMAGGLAFEEIIDKNKMLDVLPFSNDVDLIISGSTNDTIGYDDKQDDIVYSVLENFIANATKNSRALLVNGFAMLCSINKLLIESEHKFNVNLDYYKPKLNEWSSVVDLFSEDKFTIHDRSSITSPGVRVYSLILDYKGISIQIMEVSNKIVNVPSEYTSNSYMKLLNYKWVYYLIHGLITKPDYIKKDKAKARFEVLIDNKPWANKRVEAFHPDNGKGVHFDFTDPTKTVMCRNEESMINEYAEDQASVIKHKKETVESLRCYMGSQYIDINSYLLQKNIFDNMYDREITYNHNGESHKISDVVKYMLDAYSAVDSINNNKSMAFCTIRFTNPIMIGDRLVEKYRKNDIISFTSFISTAHTFFKGQSQFTSINSPLVVFRFFMSNESKGKFIFLKNVYPSDDKDYEVLIRCDTPFLILNKSYVTIKLDDVYTQKLLIDLVIVGDRAGHALYDTKYAPEVLPVEYRPSPPTKISFDAFNKKPRVPIVSSNTISEQNIDTSSYIEDTPYVPFNVDYNNPPSEMRPDIKPPPLFEYVIKNGYPSYKKEVVVEEDLYDEDLYDEEYEKTYALQSHMSRIQALNKNDDDYDNKVKESLNLWDKELDDIKLKYNPKYEEIDEPLEEEENSVSSDYNNTKTDEAAELDFIMKIKRDAIDKLKETKLNDYKNTKEYEKIMDDYLQSYDDIVKKYEYANLKSTDLENKIEDDYDYDEYSDDEYMGGGETLKVCCFIDFDDRLITADTGTFNLDFNITVATHLCNVKKFTDLNRLIKLPKPINGYKYLDKNIFTYLPEDFFTPNTVANNNLITEFIKTPRLDIFSKLKDNVPKIDKAIIKNFSFLTAVAKKPSRESKGLIQQMVDLFTKPFATPKLQKKLLPFTTPKLPENTRSTPYAAAGGNEPSQLWNILCVMVILLIIWLVFYLIVDYMTEVLRKPVCTKRRDIYIL